MQLASSAALSKATPQPARPTDPVELRLARSAALLLLALSIPTIAVAWLLAGTGGALGATIGAAVVIGMFLMTGSMMSWAARISPTAMLAAALGGYLLRLMIYAGLIVLLRPVEAIHDASLAISAAVLLVIALAWEVRLVSRQPSLFWVDPKAPTPRSAGAQAPGAGVIYSDPLANAGAGPSHDPSSASNAERTRP